MMSLAWTSSIYHLTPLLAEFAVSPTTLGPSTILWTLLGLWVVALILFRIQSATWFTVGLALTLIIVHHDFWNWGVTERSIGELPRGFVFHVGLSIVVAFCWWIVTLVAWPKDDWAGNNEISQAKSQPDEAADNSGAKA